MSSAAIQIKDLSFSYRPGSPVLAIDSLAVNLGDTVFLHGPSGSGKTTLLGLLGGILSPDKGQIGVLGANLPDLSQSQRDAFRGENVGFIFQMFNLIPYLNVEENIVLPCLMSSKRKARLGKQSVAAAAGELAEKLGIASLLGKRATDLSVGQQQRVAAARAFIGAPKLVIADEPTSALDTDHRAAFIKLLFSVCESAQSTLVFVSHDRSLASLFSKQLDLVQINGVKS